MSIRVGDTVCFTSEVRNPNAARGEVVGMERDRFALRLLVRWFDTRETTSEHPSRLTAKGESR